MRTVTVSSVHSSSVAGRRDSTKFLLFWVFCACRFGEPIGLCHPAAHLPLLYACAVCCGLPTTMRLRVLSSNELGEYTSLPQLIAKNTDYLIDSISMRMKHLGLYPNTPQV